MAVVAVTPALNVSIGADVQGVPGAYEVPQVQANGATIAWATLGAMTFLPPASGGDDTLAVQTVFSAVPASGGAVILPATFEHYTLSDTIQVNNPTTIHGWGSGSGAKDTISAPQAISYFEQTADKTAFQFNADGCRVYDVATACTAAAPAAAEGLYFAAGRGAIVDRCLVSGFYNGIHFEEGELWKLTNSKIMAPRNYGLLVRNAANPDGGDMTVYGCDFYAQQANAAAALRWESGGGMRWLNNKINKGTSAFFFAKGLDIKIASGATTGVIIIDDASIENCTDTGIDIGQVVSGQGALSFIEIGGKVEILMTGVAVNHAINIAAAANTQINKIAIGDGIALRSASATAKPAVNLSNVANVYMGKALVSSFTSTFLTDSGCTAIYNRSARPTIVPFDNGGDKTTTSTTMVDLQPAVSVGASPGDVLRLKLQGMTFADAAARNIFFQFARSDNAVLGPTNMLTSAAANESKQVAFEHFYTVQAADLSSGSISVKPRWRVSAGTGNWINSNDAASEARYGEFVVENLGYLVAAL